MTKWEYLIEDLPDEPYLGHKAEMEWLNKRGAVGWELVTVQHRTARFKRVDASPITVQVDPAMEWLREEDGA